MRLTERGFTSGRGLRASGGGEDCGCPARGRSPRQGGGVEPGTELDEAAQLEAFEERAAIAEFSGG